MRGQQLTLKLLNLIGTIAVSDHIILRMHGIPYVYVAILKEIHQ